MKYGFNLFCFKGSVFLGGRDGKGKHHKTEAQVSVEAFTPSSEGPRNPKHQRGLYLALLCSSLSAAVSLPLPATASSLTLGQSFAWRLWGERPLYYHLMWWGLLRGRDEEAEGGREGETEAESGRD